MADPGEEVFHFGPPEARKLGVRHLPDGAARGPAVVLCNPFGHEAVRAHRALRQLALRLSARSVPVLRFDYTGCGDSYGDEGAAGTGRWIRDVADAAERIRTESGVRDLCLVGARLGAAIALRAARAADGVRFLVLWDPVARGAAYLEELEREHAGMLAAAHVVDRPAPDGMPERLGFAFPPSLARDLAELAPAPGEMPRVERVLIVESDARSDAELVQRALAERGAEVERRRVNDESPWQWMADPARAVLPAAAIAAVVEWIGART